MALGEAVLRPESWDQLHHRWQNRIPPPPWANDRGDKLVQAAGHFAAEPDQRNLLPIPEGEPALDELEREYLLKVLKAFREVREKQGARAFAKPSGQSA